MALYAFVALSGQAAAADFTFKVPVRFALACDKPVTVHATCLVGAGEFRWATINEGPEAVTWERFIENGTVGDVVGGSFPAAGNGSSPAAKLTYDGDNTPINTTLTVAFDALPQRHPAQATHWKCYTTLEIGGQYVRPGSVSQLAAPGTATNCAFADPEKPLAVFFEGALPRP
ncbi:MAG TPA: hypothetical protein ENJ19_07570 [Gammaproteobacteria bacterium]|nr:hypothetical protein [Gammaproteobacteria bacterium]